MLWQVCPRQLISGIDTSNKEWHAAKNILPTFHSIPFEIVTLTYIAMINIYNPLVHNLVYVN